MGPVSISPLILCNASNLSTTSGLWKDCAEVKYLTLIKWRELLLILRQLNDH